VTKETDLKSAMTQLNSSRYDKISKQQQGLNSNTTKTYLYEKSLKRKHSELSSDSDASEAVGVSIGVRGIPLPPLSDSECSGV
jgi:CHAT domain-containing protein